MLPNIKDTKKPSSICSSWGLLTEVDTKAFHSIKSNFGNYTNSYQQSFCGTFIPDIRKAKSNKLWGSASELSGVNESND